MSNWPTVPLGAAVELAYGKPLPKSMRSEGGEIPVYGSNGITGWHSEAVVNEPTVIVGRKGSAGAVQYVDGPCYPIDTTYFVRPRDGFAFDTRFLFYLLRWLDLSRLRTATGVPGLTREDAYRESIPVPPMSDQERIVDLLARAEGIVRLRREAQQKAAELIPAIFIDMFGDPATNPNGWPVVSMGELVGEFRYGTSQKSGPVGTPVLRIPNVVDGAMDLAEVKLVSLTSAEHERLRLVDGDVLFVRTNGNPDFVGRCSVYDSQVLSTGGFDGADCVYASYLIRARLADSRVLPVYLQAYLSSRRGRQLLRDRAKTSAGQFNLNIDGLSSLPVIVPPQSLQRSFAEHLGRVARLSSLHRSAKCAADASFQSVLARAFA
jgi:type I restriction enzyme, S subunit